MQVLALIQARMGSTRLPGKVLAPILGKPMLQWQLERLALSKRITKTVVATSTQPQDTAIYEFCRSIGALAFRGSEASVLDRFYHATLALLTPYERQDATLIRLTGDCPLVDPFMVDEGIERFLKVRAGGCRYQGYEADMPDGMDFEIFTWEALDEVYNTETDEFEKEHATPYMWRHPARFGLQKFSKPGIPGGLRFSVDYAEDRDLVEGILRIQEERGSFLGVREITELLASDPKLCEINSKVVKNEGLFKTSLASDKFKTELNGRKVSIYGISIPPSLEASEEFFLWCALVGLTVWSVTGSSRTTVSRLLDKAPELKAIVSDRAPRDWAVVASEGGWEKKLLALSGDSKVRGILLETADRATLAAMLTFLCQTRFTLSF